MRDMNRFYRNRSWIVDLLAIAFGIGTWIGINGTFIQLPILVETAPEGWKLPSYLSVMVQVGNIGPIAYTLALRFSRVQRKRDSKIIYALLSMGTIAALLTAFLYKKISFVFGEPHSLALFILTAFTALNACTSSVLFMPYMGRFKEIYLVTYFVGEGLSGLLPSVAALIQGIGTPPECRLVNTTANGEDIYEMYTEPPRFGTQAFFIFIFLMMLCSCVGFTLLHRLKLARLEYANVSVTASNNYQYGTTTRSMQTIPTLTKTETEVQAEMETETEINVSQVVASEMENTKQIPTKQAHLLLLLIGIVSFFSNGMFQSIQSYSCLPYGGNAYHLSATLSVIANPVACFLAIFLPHTSLRSIISLTGIAALLTTYVFVTAVMSPLPLLHGTTAGAAIVVTVWTLLIGFISYIKLCISSVMRAQGGHSLVWTGALTQLGSLIGSVLIFVLINYTKTFTAAPSEEC